MTTPGRAQRRRESRQPRPPSVERGIAASDEWLCVQAGWAENDTKLEQVKRQTHDYVIEGLGDTRTSGVQWRIIHTEPGQFKPGEAAYETLENLIGSASEELLAQVYRPIRARLREYGGYLVLAMANGRRDA